MEILDYTDYNNRRTPTTIYLDRINKLLFVKVYSTSSISFNSATIDISELGLTNVTLNLQKGVSSCSATDSTITYSGDFFPGSTIKYFRSLALFTFD